MRSYIKINGKQYAIDSYSIENDSVEIVLDHGDWDSILRQLAGERVKVGTYRISFYMTVSGISELSKSFPSYRLTGTLITKREYKYHGN